MAEDLLNMALKSISNTFDKITTEKKKKERKEKTDKQEAYFSCPWVVINCDPELWQPT